MKENILGRTSHGVYLKKNISRRISYGVHLKENILGRTSYEVYLKENISRELPEYWTHLMENILRSRLSTGLISWRTSQGGRPITGPISSRTSQGVARVLGSSHGDHLKEYYLEVESSQGVYEDRTISRSSSHEDI